MPLWRLILLARGWLQGMSSLRKLTSLDASLNQLESLGDIVRCFSLEELRLGHNQLTDVGGLCKLTRLTVRAPRSPAAVRSAAAVLTPTCVAPVA